MSDSGHPQPEEESIYQYRKLNNNDCLRMLTLAAGKPADALQGKLDIVDVNSAGEYEAISYVWKQPGPPDRKYEILICEGDDKPLLKLDGGSLFSALIRLRHEDKERRLWADQICIDQNNLLERGLQVQLMDQIYKNSSHVLVWLGLDEAGEATAAFDLVAEVNRKLEDENERAKFRYHFTRELEKQSVEDWNALYSLTNRPWASRSR